MRMHMEDLSLVSSKQLFVAGTEFDSGEILERGPKPST